MKHIVFTLRQCDSSLLDDESYIRNMLVTAAQCANSTLLGIQSHKFDPQGVTAIAMLAESHISIHTWPENGEAVCDAFTCGEHTDPHEAFTFMRKALLSKKWCYQTIKRPVG
jgi:S-adenosylmethionine decarboxylase